ncbi:Vacuolar sorting-associated protein [Nymphaea thermarum]|nr:Vacuolar sorting-associated protein [Nymphaea thermarum]
MEIFTKIEFTQESVILTIVKLCLKSFVQFVRLQTFNHSGFQQIQLDMQFLRAPLKEIADDDAAIDFLLDEERKRLARRYEDRPFPAPLPGVWKKTSNITIHSLGFLMED